MNRVCCCTEGQARRSGWGRVHPISDNAPLCRRRAVSERRGEHNAGVVFCRCSRLRFPGSKWDSNSSPVLFQTLTKEGFDSISSGSKELLISALRELEGNSASFRHLHSEHNMAVFL